LSIIHKSRFDRGQWLQLLCEASADQGLCGLAPVFFFLKLINLK